MHDFSEPTSSGSRPVVVARDLGAELPHPAADLVGVEVDLADAARRAQGPVASSGRLPQPVAGGEPLEVALVEELDLDVRVELRAACGACGSCA